MVGWETTTAMNDTHRCPWCGNSKPSLIDIKVTDPDLTLLCRARIEPIDHPDGLVECGHQWCPNNDEDGRESEPGYYVLDDEKWVAATK
jgi:hypothetical protein